MRSRRGHQENVLASALLELASQVEGEQMTLGDYAKLLEFRKQLADSSGSPISAGWLSKWTLETGNEDG